MVMGRSSGGRWVVEYEDGDEKELTDAQVEKWRVDPPLVLPAESMMHIEVISRPIDIQTIASRVEDSAHQGHYASYDAFSADMLRIFVNARECQQSRLI